MLLEAPKDDEPNADDIEEGFGFPNAGLPKAPGLPGFLLFVILDVPNALGAEEFVLF